MKTTAVYFSATYTTKRITEYIASALSDKSSFIDITNDNSLQPISLSDDELLIVGIPVYGGRVPAIATERIKRFKGNNTPAVALAIYGNRHYDDALIELYDILTECDFRIVSAGAFIARHSIFTKVASDRPNEQDFNEMDSFAKETLSLINGGFTDITLTGNRPYKIPGPAAFFPTASRKCKSCNKCAKLCPTGAINTDDIRSVDKNKCIQCGRCVAICPNHSRRFWGHKFLVMSSRFNVTFAQPRPNELFYAQKR